MGGWGGAYLKASWGPQTFLTQAHFVSGQLGRRPLKLLLVASARCTPESCMSCQDRGLVSASDSALVRVSVCPTLKVVSHCTHARMHARTHAHNHKLA